MFRILPSLAHPTPRTSGGEGLSGGGAPKSLAAHCVHAPMAP